MKKNKGHRRPTFEQRKDSAANLRAAKCVEQLFAKWWPQRPQLAGTVQPPVTLLSLIEKLEEEIQEQQRA